MFGIKTRIHKQAEALKWEAQKKREKTLKEKRGDTK